MAVDSAILRSVAEHHAPPTLRFYAWSPFCISLGRSQSVDAVDLEACQRDGVDVVRRPTGGRAILHGDELTYSVCLPLDHPVARGDILESYRRLSQGLQAGLQMLGVSVEAAEPRKPAGDLSAACFDTPAGYEMTVGGRKLLGSAQYRARGGLLQHGSLALLGDIARIVRYLALTPEERASLAERVRETAVTLEEAAGRWVPFSEAAEALARGFEAALGVQFAPGELCAEEKATAVRLQTDRYDRAEWSAGGAEALRIAAG